MHAHIIPGRGLQLVRIPARTYISMSTGKYCKYIWIVQKCLVMISVSHDMAGEKQLVVFFINKNGHLRSYRHIGRVTTAQKSKRVFFDEFQNDVSILFFKIRKVVHRAKI